MARSKPGRRRRSDQLSGPEISGRTRMPAQAGRPDETRGPAPREGAVQVSEVQRARVLAAMVWVVAEDGVSAATVSRIVRQAGVSRRTFYELFSGSEDCFLAAFDDLAERARNIVIQAGMVAGSSSWREQVRAGLSALLSFFDEEPLSGSFLVVDALGGGAVVLERRTRILGALTAILSAGGSEVKSVTPPPPLAAEGTVGAVLIGHSRTHAGRGSSSIARALESLDGDDRAAVSGSRGRYQGADASHTKTRSCTKGTHFARITLAVR